MLCVWSVSGQKLTEVPAGDTFEDVMGLKCHLRSRHGFPVRLQQLLKEGVCLEDGALLVEPVDLQLVLLSALDPVQMLQAELEFLEHFADAGHVEVGRALLAAGVDKDRNIWDRYSHQTALMLASSRGHGECVRLLLDAGADRNLQNRFGQTALIRASCEGHVEIVRSLLDARADKNLQNILGGTALMHASGKGHIEVLRLLLDAGADKNLRDCGDRNALMHASSAAHADIARLLAKA